MQRQCDRPKAAPRSQATKRRSRLDADLVTDEDRDAELDDDRVDGVDEGEISACAPYLAR